MTDSGPNQNVEIKSRCPDLGHARAKAMHIGAVEYERLKQVDTYFEVTSGRLKLRQFDRGPSQLIWYARPNENAARTSTYRLVEIAEGDEMRQLLAAGLRTRGQVKKSREVLLWKNVRIHLDDVEGLGQFIEIESVVSADCDLNLASQRVEYLCTELAIRVEDMIGVSYSDLLGF